jgi:hypothetical protein
MSVQRYEMEYDYDDTDIHECEDGTYVKYEDYQKLEELKDKWVSNAQKAMELLDKYNKLTEAIL